MPPSATTSSQVNQRNRQPSMRMQTHTGEQAKHSLRTLFSMMNFGFPKETMASTAEMVSIRAHKSGRTLPIAPFMMSANSFTAIVQVSLTRIGIIKSSTPMVDGMINISFSFFSSCMAGLLNISELRITFCEVAAHWHIPGTV